MGQSSKREQQVLDVLRTESVRDQGFYLRKTKAHFIYTKGKERGNVGRLMRK